MELAFCSDVVFILKLSSFSYFQLCCTSYRPYVPCLFPRRRDGGVEDTFFKRKCPFCIYDRIISL
jgi:hypothetical protein